MHGRLYVSTSLGQVAAIDAGTGRTIWSYDPESYRNDIHRSMGSYIGELPIGPILSTIPAVSES